MSKAYGELQTYMDKAVAIKIAMTLFEWDNETLAPREAGELTFKVIEVLSGEYLQVVTYDETEKLLGKCRGDKSLTMAEAANARKLLEEREQICPTPQDEYQGFARLTARAISVWARTRKDQDFEAFVPTLEKVIGFQKKSTGYRAKDGRKLYDAMLDDYEKGFFMENLDRFSSALKKQLVLFLKKVMEEGKMIENSFLRGDYPEEKQEELGRFLAEYVGFDFDRGVMAANVHPLTTNLHNKGVRIITHYTDRVDSPLSSVIHEAGHAIHELGIGDDLTLTPVSQGVNMGIHESQSWFSENIIGRGRSLWVPIYDRVQAMFPEQLGKVDLDQFVEAVNKVTPGLIRIEANELSCSLHALIRYEVEKTLIGEDLDVEKLPRFWTDKHEEYLGVHPESPAEGVLQDTHQSQGSSGYFPSYALGSAFGAQLYYHMKEITDFDSLLKDGRVDVIRGYLREHIHQYGKLEDSCQILKDATGEDFNPECYVRYLEERYSRLCGLENEGQVQRIQTGNSQYIRKRWSI